MATEKKEQKKPARLEDLDVREVSTVDRPANRRPFLIVKRDGETQITVGETMSEDLFDQLLGDVTVDASAANLDDAPLLAPVEKGATGADAFKAAKNVLSKLMEAVKELKALGDKDPPPSLQGKFQAVVDALATIAGAEKEKAQKIEGAVLPATTDALASLTDAVTKLKAADVSAELPSDIASALKGVVGKLRGALAKMGESSEETQKAETQDDTVQKQETQQAAQESKPPQESKPAEQDPVLVLKIGAKMRKASLNKLRQVHKMLTELLKEYDEGAAEGAAAPTKKSDGAGDNHSGLKLEDIQKAVSLVVKAELAPATDKLDVLEKRIKELEETTPEGNGDSEPVQKEQERPFWGGVL